MNILIHATLYPEGETQKRANTTLFIHTYAAEWVRMGHNVLVIHHKIAFAPLMVRVGRFLAARTGRLPNVDDYLTGYGEDADRDFVRDGVLIARRGLKKWIPRTLFSGAVIGRRARMVAEELARRAFKPDLVVCDFINPGLFAALRMGGAPIVAALHRTDFEYLSRAVTARAALRAVRQADGLAFRSEVWARAFEARYFSPPRRLLMPSGIPADWARPAESVRFRRQVRHVLCVARLVRNKHVDAVIRAFGRLEVSDASLTIVGDGVERAALEALAGAQKNAAAIRFTGVIERGAVLEAMARADVFALVSEKESFGMVYIEAMSVGAVPIGSLGEGAADYIRPDECGLLVPAGDAQALFEALSALMAMAPARVEALSRAAHAQTLALRDDVLAARALEAMVGFGQTPGLHAERDGV